MAAVIKIMKLTGTNQNIAVLETNGVFSAKGLTPTQSLIRWPQGNVQVYDSATRKSYNLEFIKRDYPQDTSTKPTTSTMVAKTGSSQHQRTTSEIRRPAILGKRSNSGLSVRSDLTEIPPVLPLTLMERVANKAVSITKVVSSKSSFQLSVPTGSKESVIISSTNVSTTSTKKNPRNHQDNTISEFKRPSVPPVESGKVEPTVFVHVHDDFSDEIKVEPKEEPQYSPPSNKRTKLVDISKEKKNRSSDKDLVRLLREESEKEKNELNVVVTNLTNQIKGLQDQTIKMKEELKNVRKENLKLKKELKEFENQNLMLNKQLVNVESKHKQAETKIREKCKIIEWRSKELSVKMMESQNMKKKIMGLEEKVHEAKQLAHEILKI